MFRDCARPERDVFVTRKECDVDEQNVGERKECWERKRVLNHIWVIFKSYLSQTWCELIRASVLFSLDTLVTFFKIDISLYNWKIIHTNIFVAFKAIFSAIIFTFYVAAIISKNFIILIIISAFTLHLIFKLKHLTINRSTLYLVLHYWNALSWIFLFLHSCFISSLTLSFIIVLLISFTFFQMLKSLSLCNHLNRITWSLFCHL